MMLLNSALNFEVYPDRIELYEGFTLLYAARKVGSNGWALSRGSGDMLAYGLEKSEAVAVIGKLCKDFR